MKLFVLLSFNGSALVKRDMEGTGLGIVMMLITGSDLSQYKTLSVVHFIVRTE